jgi:hypothetical protein
METFSNELAALNKHYLESVCAQCSARLGVPQALSADTGDVQTIQPPAQA